MEGSAQCGMLRSGFEELELEALPLHENGESFEGQLLAEEF